MTNEKYIVNINRGVKSLTDDVCIDCKQSPFIADKHNQCTLFINTISLLCLKTQPVYIV